MSRDAPRFCEHCGLPVGAGKSERSDADGSLLSFCCLGCSLAWRIVGPGGRDTGSRSASQLVRIVLGFVLSMIIMLIRVVRYVEPETAATQGYDDFAPIAQLIACTPVVLVLGVPYLWNAVAGLRRFVIGADVLIAIGIFAGYAASVTTVLRGQGEPLFFDTVAGLATLVTVGRWLEASAKERATAGLRGFLSDASRPARRVSDPSVLAGQEEAVHASDLVVGDLVRVRPGEQVPADGTVVQGEALVDEAALTGESLPRAVAPGDVVRAPTIATDGALHVRVDHVGDDTLLANVGRVLAQARAERAPAERLADRIASVFVPAVVILATWVFVRDLEALGSTADAALHALAVLVIACPCALGIATPLALTAAMGSLAKRGILVRSGLALTTLPRAKVIAFDKTGTLTAGVPRLGGIHVREGQQEDEVLALAAAVEQASESAWARAIREAARSRGLDVPRADEFQVHPGRGVEAEVGGQQVRVGSARWLDRQAPEDAIIVEVGGQPVAELALEDTIRPDAEAMVRELHARNLEVHVISGDAAPRVAQVGARLGVAAANLHSGLLPDEKVAQVGALRASSAGPVAFVGDGINDAPALTAADLGLAVGSGTDLARESAAVSLLGSDLSRVPWLLDAARLTRRAVAWNLFWAFAYNLVGITWAVVWGLPPVLAALAMVFSSLSVILASLRLRLRLAPGESARTGGEVPSPLPTMGPS